MMQLVHQDGAFIVESTSIVYNETMRGWDVEGFGLFSDFSREYVLQVAPYPPNP